MGRDPARRAAAWPAVVLALAALACAGRPADGRAVVPPGPLRSDPVTFELAVYYLPVPASDPLAHLGALLAHDFPGFRPVPQLSVTRGRSVAARLERDVQGSYAPPDAEGLRLFGRGLTPEQATALRSSREALVLDFRISGELPFKGLRAACELAGRIARETGGLVWDETTREVFTPEAWDDRRLSTWTEEIPEVSQQTALHLYRKDDGMRAISLGMAKLGLPDVVVEGFGAAKNHSMENLVNLLEQAFAEGAVVGPGGKLTLRLRDLKNAAAREPQVQGQKPNARGEARLRLRSGVKEEGDPPNRLIAIAFDRYPGPDLPARQESLLDALFGSEESAVVYTQHDEELLAASRAARAELPALHRAFDAGLQADEYILVKAPFVYPGGNEWMWVEVLAWKDGTITGLLKNVPISAKGLKVGQTVTVSEADLFDFIHHRPDGTDEGNRTGAILETRERRP